MERSLARRRPLVREGMNVPFDIEGELPRERAGHAKNPQKQARIPKSENWERNVACARLEGNVRRFGRRASINWFLFYGLPPLGAVNGRNGLNSSLRVQIGRHVTPDHKQKLTAFRQNLLAQKSHGCTRQFQGTRTPLPRPTLRRNGMPRRWAPGGQRRAKAGRRRRAKAGRARQKAVEDCTCLIDGLYTFSMSRSRSMSR